MALDSVLLGALIREIRPKTEGAAVERVFQPSRDEVIFSVRGREGGEKLAFSLSPNFPGLYFTQAKRENPQTPPMFCMLLRKHLSGARILSVEQEPGERIVLLRMACLNELGDRTQKLIIAELMGRRTNLILAQENGLIIDCLKHVTPDDPSGRRLLPGLYYEPPKPLEKKFFPLMEEREIVEALNNEFERGAPAAGGIYRALGGITTLVAGEVCCRAGADPDMEAGDKTEQIIAGVISLRRDILEDRLTPVMILEGQMPQDICYIDITQYGSARYTQRFDSFCSLLDAWYVRRGSLELLRSAARDLRKAVSSAREREARKIAARQGDLARCADREELRKDGELIISNIYRLKKGETFLEAPDYSLDGAPLRRVRLDPLKTPQQNAAEYFREYRKACKAIEHLTALVEAGKEQLIYLDSVLDELERASSPSELREIRIELESSGVLTKKKDASRRKDPPSAPPHRVLSDGGYEILIGRNNRQNDELTFRLARKDDLWLHVKDYPGSHVIIRCRGGQPDEQTVALAAALAAEHSRAGGQAAVDVTQVRYVKKSPGAKPGMVTYSNHYTVITGNPRQAP